jgi:hypothetical protein
MLRSVCLSPHLGEYLRPRGPDLRPLRLVHRLPVGPVDARRLECRRALVADGVVDLLLDAGPQSEVELELSAPCHEIGPSRNHPYVDRQARRHPHRGASPGADHEVDTDGRDADIGRLVVVTGDVETR